MEVLLSSCMRTQTSPCLNRASLCYDWLVKSSGGFNWFPVSPVVILADLSDSNQRFEILVWLVRMDVV